MRARASRTSALHVGVLPWQSTTAAGMEQKMNCQKRADPLPTIFLLAMVGAAITAQNLAPRCHFCSVFHEPPKSFAIQASHFTFPQRYGSTSRASTDKVRTTPTKCPRNSNNHGPTGLGVCLGRDTQTPARRKTVSPQCTSISKILSRIGTVGSPSSIRVASIRDEVEPRRTTWNLAILIEQ